MFSQFRRTVWKTISASFLFAALTQPLPTLGAADADTPVEINIPAGSLVKALEQLGHQSGIQVIYETSLARGVNVKALSGKLTVRAALAQLLVNTGLTVDRADERTVVLKRAHPSSSGVTPADQMRVASAETEKEKEQTTGQDGGAADQVVVEGQRDRPAPFSTANLDLTRTEDDVLPFTVFTARDIELSGAANLQEFFQNRLPQNFNMVIPNEDDGSGSSYTSWNNRVDMRGWGTHETVYLLNGRRMMAQYRRDLTDLDSEDRTPDFQSIPLGSIERIEILSSAGSAIYGESATGGVINIITRQDFRGGQLAVSYASPSDVHRPRRSVDFSYGLPLKAGLSLRFSGGYQDSTPLFVKDRADVTIMRYRRLAMERDPSFLSTAAYGSTPNFRTASSSGSNLFGPGTPNFGSVREGYAGGQGLEGFVPGVYNYELPEGVAGGFWFAKESRIGIETSTFTISAGVDKTFGADWRWSLDYRYSGTRGNGLPETRLFFTSATAVPAEAPINPFGQSVRVMAIDWRLDPRLLGLYNRPYNITNELSSTLRGGYGDWRGIVDVSFSENRNRDSTLLYVEPGGGWVNAFMEGRYNPFVDMRTVAPASPEFYDDYVISVRHYLSATRNAQAAIKASGSLFRLPSGVAQLTLGADWSRADRYKSSRSGEYQDGRTREPRIPSGAESSDIPGSQVIPLISPNFVFSTYAAYAEINIPVLAPVQDIPLVECLDLFASGRMSWLIRNGIRSADSQPFQYVNRPYVHAVGLSYEMIRGMTFRVSRSIGYKPVSIIQTLPRDSNPTQVVTVTDPRRGGQNGEQVILNYTQYVAGGNPDLRPETSNSMNFGLIVAPASLPGFRLSIDYLHTIRDDAFEAPSAQLVVDLEAELPGRVIRGAPDGDPSGVGPIEFIDYRYINFNRIASKSLDVSIDQRIGHVWGGALSYSIAATRNLSFKVQTTPSALPVEQVRNVNGSFSRQIAWNGNAQVRWEGKRWSFGWSTRYFDYILVAPRKQQLQGSDRVDWALDHDFNASLRIPQAPGTRGLQDFLGGMSISFGVKNVFNREPRFFAGLSNVLDEKGVAPGDSIMGRSVWLSMRKNFGGL